MAQPWEAERGVDRELARRLVADRFPDLADVEPQPFGAGWDNTAWRFGDWIFRFPRRQIAVPALEAECRILPELARRLPLAISAPTRVGEPTEDFPWPFAGYRCIQGTTACVANLDSAERAAAAEPLARFLHALHSIAAPAARELGAGPDTFGRLERTRSEAAVHERLSQLRERGVAVDAERIVRVLAELPDTFEPRASALVHGDFYVRHIIIGAGRRVAGVIDWGDVHIGDPALDLALFATWIPAAARPAFERAYGRIDDTTRRAMRFRGACHSLALLHFAHHIGDAVLEREARYCLAGLDA